MVNCCIAQVAGGGMPVAFDPFVQIDPGERAGGAVLEGLPGVENFDFAIGISRVACIGRFLNCRLRVGPLRTHVVGHGLRLV